MWFSKLILGLLALLGTVLLCSPAYGRADIEKPPVVTGRYASIVVDADSLEIVHARQIDAPRYPASLTKVMTLLLTFDALDEGRVRLSTPMTVSRYAAKTAPSKLGLPAGSTITVEDAIKAVAVKSANDMAVVLAEHLAGSEEAFAAQMTARAQGLGMRNTTFKNPHGLPHINQTTTARDLAKLAHHVLLDKPHYYHYFGIEEFSYKGRRYKNTNGLLHNLDGVDGFKTGYTRASGYNLIVSAARDGRRVIAIVLGGASGAARNSHMSDLIEASFDTLGVTALPAPDTPAKVAIARKVVTEPVPDTSTPTLTRAIRLRGRNSEPVTVILSGPELAIAPKSADNDWAIQLGAFRSEAASRAHIDAVALMLPGEGPSPDISPIDTPSGPLYRARIRGFSAADAQAQCRKLSRLKTGCIVIAPAG